jgi:Mg-chelatase subunit ChlD
LKTFWSDFQSFIEGVHFEMESIQSRLFKHGWRAALPGLCALLILTAPLAAFAQQLSSRLIVRSCDTAKFPSVTCSVSLIDPQGLPVTGAPAAAFAVSEGDISIKVDGVAEGPSGDASTSTLMVVDLSGSLSGKYVGDLRAAIEASLQNKPINELVGLIALTGKIANPSSADDIVLDPARESTFSKDANEAVINKLRGLTAATSTPLHDGLIKAILMTRKQPFGARAVVVMTDGFDNRSTATNVDDVITLARQEGIPIYTFGFGATRDEDKLRRLAVTTGGAYYPATDASSVAGQFREIQNRLKNQYAISFVLPGNDKGERNLNFNANLTDRKVDGAQTLFKPEAPEVPVIEAVQFTLDGQAQQPESLPAGTISVEPQIFAKAVSKVEYQVNDGEIVVSYQQPFAYALRTADLNLAAQNQLKVKVFGAEGRADLISEQTIPLALAAGAASTTDQAMAAPAEEAPPEPTATRPPEDLITTFTGNPVLMAALVVGVLALLALLIMIITSVARNRKAQQAGSATVVMDGGFSPYSTSVSPVGGAPSDTGSGATAIFASTNEQPTQIFADPGEGQKTQVWQPPKAVLEILSGAGLGKKFPLGTAGKSTVVIGRDVDAFAGDVKLDSTYVSRRHAEIRIEGDDLFLVDLGSSSGTRLNGAKLAPEQKQKIEIDNEITFADVKTKIAGV